MRELEGAEARLPEVMRLLVRALEELAAGAGADRERAAEACRGYLGGLRAVQEAVANAVQRLGTAVPFEKTCYAERQAAINSADHVRLVADRVRELKAAFPTEAGDP